MSADVKKCIQANGGMYDGGWYLCYEAGEKDAVLDGRFSADDLEAIAAQMRKSQAEKQ